MVFTLLGCSRSEKRIDWPGMVQRSSLFAEVKKRAAHPACMIDYENKEVIVFAIGDEKAAQFDRWYTVKIVKATRRLYKLGPAKPGEDIWQPVPMRSGNSAKPK